MVRKKAGGIRPPVASFYYGWVIVGLGSLAMFLSGLGQTISISVFIDQYIANFGWSRSVVSGFYSAATLLAGSFLYVMGRLLDRYGHRVMMTVVAFLLGLSCLWMSFIRNLAMLFAGFAGLRYFGQGALNLAANTLIPKWFTRRRGFAMSFVVLGLGVGCTFLPPLNNRLLMSYGLQLTWSVWAVVLLGVMVPLSWLLTRDSPEEIGVFPGGHGEDRDNGAHNGAQGGVEPVWTLEQVLRTRVFWQLLFCQAVSALVNAGILFHIVSLVEEKGFSSSYAALLLSILSVVQSVLLIPVGRVIDRLKVHRVLGLNYFLLSLTVFILYIGKAKWSLIGFSLVLGVFSSFENVGMQVIWPNYYGVKYLPGIRSMSMTAGVLGSSLGPLPLGLAYDLLGGYREALILLMVLPVAAAVAAFSSPPPVLRFQPAKAGDNSVSG